MHNNKMFFLILLSIILGIVCGIFLPDFMLSIRWIGAIFINILKLIVLPLIFCAIVSAIASMESMKKLGRVGTYTLIYILISLSIAVTIGLILLNVFQPGVGLPPSIILANASHTDVQPVAFAAFLLTIFPPNIVAAAAKYEIMPIVFFSMVFALACLSTGETAKIVIDFFVGMRNVLIKMIMWLMVLTPIGLFSLLGAAVAEAFLQNRLWDSIQGMLFFIVIFLFGLFCQILWQLLVVQFILRKNAKEFISHAGNALVTAFATSSSIATMPVALVVSKNQGVSDEVARFVLPFATAINMAGTAMYEAVCALFFCQILGLHLSIFSQLGVFITAILAGIGAAGIPEGGLVTMVMVLRAVNVPTSAIALLLPFDRILDRCRTMTNVWGDLVCAAVVDRLTSAETRATAAIPEVD